MRITPLIPAVLILTGFSVCVAAEQTEYATVVAEADAPSKIVSFGDLNLQRHEGVATLYRRIEVAANFVCKQVNHRIPQIALRERMCASDATARAVDKVDLPALTALHAKLTAQPSKTMVAARDSH